MKKFTSLVFCTVTAFSPSVFASGNLLKCDAESVFNPTTQLVTIEPSLPILTVITGDGSISMDFSGEKIFVPENEYDILKTLAPLVADILRSGWAPVRLMTSFLGIADRS
jgi:hypothetical protein